VRRIKADSLTPITLRVNGRLYRAVVEPRMLLSDFLREECGLTGTHIGCEHGVCGACTVLVNGTAVRSCLMLAVALEDQEITTIEGLTKHPAFPAIYRALTEHHALQCGFCTPGIVVSAMAEVLGREVSAEEIDDILSGHLCRCTGYLGIKAALREIARISAPSSGVSS
jgi:aerobic-type carbon monoxide dehydrogenase small subunit (CoxS/CutS family)